MSSTKLIPISTGTGSPEYWADVEARQSEYGEDAGLALKNLRRPDAANPDLDWATAGFTPRWLGDEVADCVVALQPSIFHGQGADEYRRFRDGAASRGELALTVSKLGRTESGTHNVFSNHDDSVSLGDLYTSVVSTRLGNGAQVALHGLVAGADRDLGLRLLNATPALTWWTIELSGATSQSSFGDPTYHPPEGTIHPILVTPLGETVVGAWISEDGSERRYVVPQDVPWELVLNWLTSHGLPEHVPAAMRRSRASIALPDALLTTTELQLRHQISDLQANYEAERARLNGKLDAERARATDIRDRLLYGTGQDLVDAVAALLRLAGIDVVDLDKSIGDTINADLRCSFEHACRLVEVKSASGAPGERLYSDLVRHVAAWPTLPGAERIDGGALILNHEHKKEPLDRTSDPYTRPEFLAAQTHPVLTTLQLFLAWRDSDWAAVRAALFGAALLAPPAEDSTATTSQPTSGAGVLGSPTERGRGRRFRRRQTQ